MNDFAWKSEMNKQTKAAIYVRVSTIHQAEHGHGIKGQINTCSKLCKFKKMDIYKIYKDEAISGKTKQTDRDGFKEMLEDAKNKKFDAVVVYRLDRIGRNIRGILKSIDKFEDMGLKIISCEENFDTSTDDGILMKNMYAVVSDNELRVIRRRLREGLEKKRHQDGCIGGNCVYGYRRIDKTFRINPETAPIVKYIFDLHDKGISGNKIAKILTEHNIKTSTGKDKWHRNSIYNILKNKSKYMSTELIYNNKNNIYWPKIL